MAAFRGARAFGPSIRGVILAFEQSAAGGARGTSVGWRAPAALSQQQGCGAAERALPMCAPPMRCLASKSGAGAAEETRVSRPVQDNPAVTAGDSGGDRDSGAGVVELALAGKADLQKALEVGDSASMVAVLGRLIDLVTDIDHQLNWRRADWPLHSNSRIELPDDMLPAVGASARNVALLALRAIRRAHKSNPRMFQEVLAALPAHHVATLVRVFSCSRDLAEASYLISLLPRLSAVTKLERTNSVTVPGRHEQHADVHTRLAVMGCLRDFGTSLASQARAGLISNSDLPRRMSTLQGLIDAVVAKELPPTHHSVLAPIRFLQCVDFDDSFAASIVSMLVLSDKVQAPLAFKLMGILAERSCGEQASRLYDYVSTVPKFANQEFLLTSVLRAFAGSETKDAEKLTDLLDRMENLRKHSSVKLSEAGYGVILNSSAELGDAERVRRWITYLEEDKFCHEEINSYHMNLVIKAAKTSCDPLLALKAYAEVQARGLECNTHTYGAILETLCERSRRLASDLAVSTRGKEPDTGPIRLFDSTDAELTESMQRDGWTCIHCGTTNGPVPTASDVYEARCSSCGVSGALEALLQAVSKPSRYALLDAFPVMRLMSGADKMPPNYAHLHMLLSACLDITTILAADAPREAARHFALIRTHVVPLIRESPDDVDIGGLGSLVADLADKQLLWRSLELLRVMRHAGNPLDIGMFGHLMKACHGYARERLDVGWYIEEFGDSDCAPVPALPAHDSPLPEDSESASSDDEEAALQKLAQHHVAMVEAERTAAGHARNPRYCNRHLNVLVVRGLYREAWQLVSKMTKDNDNFPPPDKVTFNTLLKGAVQVGHMQHVEGIIKMMEQGRLEPDSATMRQAMLMFLRKGEFGKAREVLRSIATDSLNLFATQSLYVRGCADAGNAKEALAAFQALRKMSAEPLRYDALEALLRVCLTERLFVEAEQLFAAEFAGTASRVDVAHKRAGLVLCMIRGYAEAGKLETALKWEQRMQDEFDCSPSAQSFNILIAGMFKAGDGRQAVETFMSMADRGVSPRTSTLNVLLRGCVASKNWDLLQEVVLPALGGLPIRPSQQVVQKLLHDESHSPACPPQVVVELERYMNA